MKNIILAIYIAVLLPVSAFAQDIITTKNGDEIKSKVVEITPEVVKYKKYGMDESPLVSIYKKDVFMIKYENGEKDLFNHKSKPQSAKSIVKTQPVEEPEQKKEEKTSIIYTTIPRVKTSIGEPFPVEEKRSKQYYKDGNAWVYYKYKGIVIAMYLHGIKSYGKYFEAQIFIENNTSSDIDFDPNNITARITSNGESWTADVLSSKEYLKKVKRKQAWNAGLVGFSQGLNASSAGYSTTTSSSSTSAFVNTGDYMSTGTATTNTTSTTYDAYAQQQAQQRANENTVKYEEEQNKQAITLNQGYLKRNTIEPHHSITGYICIEYAKNVSVVHITVPLANENYDFNWGN